MKTFYAILASLLLASGSSAMAATGTPGGTTGTASERGGSVDRDFSELDRQDEGFIDQQSADEAGIPRDQFDQMDRDGDGRVTEEEFDQHHQDRDDNADDDGGWFN